MKTVALNHAAIGRRIGHGLGSAPETQNLDLLGGDLRDAYAAVLSPTPEHLLALAYRIDATRAASGHVA
ncbi:hypothetical protein [uncultured Methylobacterium sp.]|uniref:hypothetical protein n=1 Tax=uncultured Methylobacterium sp. TaxID=157278 RepID=UPI0035CAB27F